MAEGHDQAGSTLLLVPSAVLVLLLLTSLLIDGAASFLAQRELADACAGAANDAAAAALDPKRLYGTTGPPARAVDIDRAASLADSRVAPLTARWHDPVSVRAEANGPDVVLHLRATAPLPIGPGGNGRPHVDITATCRSTTVRR